MFGTLRFHPLFNQSTIYFPDACNKLCRMWGKACGGIPGRQKTAHPQTAFLGIPSSDTRCFVRVSLSSSLSLSFSHVASFHFASTLAAFGCVAEQLKEPSWYFVCACDERELKDR